MRGWGIKMAIEIETIKEKELQNPIDRLFKLCEDYKLSCKKSLNLNRRMLWQMKTNLVYVLLLMILWLEIGILLVMSL